MLNTKIELYSGADLRQVEKVALASEFKQFDRHPFPGEGVGHLSLTWVRRAYF